VLWFNSDDLLKFSSRLFSATADTGGSEFITQHTRKGIGAIEHNSTVTVVVRINKGRHYTSKRVYS